MSVSALGAAQTFAYSSAPSRPAASGGGGAVAAGHAQAAAPGGLSTADLKVVSELKARDQVVRAHEAAHLAAGAGIVTRGASYTYQTGPDGQRYAIGGEVGKRGTSEFEWKCVGMPTLTLPDGASVPAG